MTSPGRRPLHLVFAAFTVILATLLVLSSLRTYREIDEQRAVYLRSRVASLAARLETVPESQWSDALSDEEVYFESLAVFNRTNTPSALAPLWEGKELFRTETVPGVVPLFRAYVPFHSSGNLLIAQIDIDPAAADFLTVHARHHLWLTAACGLLIVTLTVLTVRWAGRLALSERRQLELQHLATLGELSASLAHEIRNPLGTIKGFAQLLAEKLDGAHASLLSPILTETTRLENLVKDLLLYGRPAAPAFQTVLSCYFEDALRQHARHLPDSSSIQFNTAVAPLSLETDPHLLDQILLNLLRNAIDAVRSQPAGRVDFELDAGPDGAHFRILDNGPGLSEEAHRRLFEPFYTSKATGTGLGLSISRKLVGTLGGRLIIERRTSGGTLAEVIIPLKRHV